MVHASFAEQRYFIEIDEVHARPVLDENPYGVVTEAKIVLWCRLREATLRSIGRGRYEVELSKRHGYVASHRNVFPDCPSRDEVYMANRDDTVYLVPRLERSRRGFDLPDLTTGKRGTRDFYKDRHREAQHLHG